MVEHATLEYSDTENGNFHEDRLMDIARDTRVHSVKSVIVDMPTVRKHKLSNTSISHQSYVIVEVRLHNGVVGHGEASTLGGPRWSEESVEAIKANIDTYLAPTIMNHSANRFESLNQKMNRAAKRNNSAKSAVNSALIDAVGKTLNVHASVLLGGEVRNSFSVIWALASGDAEQEAQEALSKIEAGEFNRFKIKLGFGSPEVDMKRLRRLREALPSHTEIVCDVNQGWDEADCIRWFPGLEELDISLVEQPLPAGQVEAMTRLSARSRIPIMLDEGVFTEDEALRAVSMGAGSVLSLKLCKHGSAQCLQRVAGIATAAGVQLYGGCLLESSQGAAAHLAVFATLPELQWGTEHFGPKILVEDLCIESLVYKNYEVMLPDGPGLGVTPDPEKLARFSRGGALT